jgi:hypothetical protein
MDAFLPGVGDWTRVWLLRDLWHFHFHGEVPLKLVEGGERIYFEHFWNDFAADRNHSIPEADRQFYAAEYAKPGGMRAGFEYFRKFEQDAKDFAGFALVDTNVEGILVKGSGHWLMEEAPEQTIPALVTSLNT